MNAYEKAANIMIIRSQINYLKSIKRVIFDIDILKNIDKDISDLEHTINKISKGIV